MTFPIIASMTGSLLIIFQQLLLLNTGMHRTSTGIGVGHDGDRHLQRKMRWHSNLAENSAVFIVMLALLEMSVGATVIVQIAAVAFLAARLFHAIGFMSLAGSHTGGEGPGIFVAFRARGAFGTVFSGVGVGGYLLYHLITSGSLPF